MIASLVRYQPFTELRRAVDSLFDESFFISRLNTGPNIQKLL